MESVLVCYKIWRTFKNKNNNVKNLLIDYAIKKIILKGCCFVFQFLGFHNQSVSTDF
jgi:hypothetical protein